MRKRITMDIKHIAPKHGLIGHRGLAGYAPENTIAAIQAAYEQGLNWVEFDVQLSKDHQLIIFHDHDLNRTTNGNGLVYDFTYSDIKALDAGAWYGSQFSGAKIPNLEKDLSQLLKYKLHFNIELKCPNSPSQAYKDALCDSFCSLIEKKWPKTRALPLVSSFEWDLLLQVRNRLKNIAIGFLCDAITPELTRLAVKTPNATINCNYHSLNDSDISRSQHLNIPLLVYTVNEQEIANQLLNQGVFGIFTDSLIKSSPSIREAI